LDYIAGFIPGLTESRAQRLLPEVLERRDYRVVESTQRSPEEQRKALVDQAFTKPSRWLQKTRLSWFAADEEDIVLSWDDGDWDLPLLRDVSALSGGFVAAVNFRSALAQYGFALFFAGRTVQAWIGNATGITVRVGEPVAREKDVLPFFRRCVGELTANRLGDVLSMQAPRTHSLAVLARSEPNLESLSAGDDAPLTRAAFPLVTEDAFSGALDRLKTSVPGDGWRWLPRRSRKADLPYILVERGGTLDEALLLTLTGALDGAALAVELGAAGWFRWLRVDSGERVLGGSASGAEALIDRWKDVGVILAEPPALLTWPSDETGRPLSPPPQQA
jgi:hypothetical protein